MKAVHVIRFRDFLLMIVITLLILIMGQNFAQYNQIAEINEFVEQLIVTPEQCQ